jgi:hypothetical protein
MSWLETCFQPWQRFELHSVHSNGTLMLMEWKPSITHHSKFRILERITRTSCLHWGRVRVRNRGSGFFPSLYHALSPPISISRYSHPLHSQETVARYLTVQFETIIQLELELIVNLSCGNVDRSCQRDRSSRPSRS